MRTVGARACVFAEGMQGGLEVLHGDRFCCLEGTSFIGGRDKQSMGSSD